MGRVRAWLASASVGLALAGVVFHADAAPADKAAGSAEAGQKIFQRQCTPCHAIESGVDKTGPSLAGVVGRKAGSTDFPRYRGLRGADFDWTDAMLDRYLADPRAFVITHTTNGTTSMMFRVPDAQERRDLIAYLKTLK